MLDWRSPRAKAREVVKQQVFSVASLMGTYQPENAVLKETAQVEDIGFFGHRIGQPRELRPHTERRLAYKHRRAEITEVQDLHYSEKGMAWSDGKLVEAHSVHPVTLKDPFRKPKNPSQELDSAYVVGCNFAYSYGDWVHCYLGPVLSSWKPDAPLLIPAHLAAKGYVKRDLEMTGIDYVATKGWTHVKQAKVINKQNPFLNWSKENVDDFLRAYSVQAPEPDPGSLMYIGRFDLVGENAPRAFPSEDVAEIVRELGGDVVIQSDLSPKTAPDYARQAETVIGDHGSGMLNMMFWKPKTVIELVVDGWWNYNNLFVAHSLGVENYAVLDVDGVNRDTLRRDLTATMAHFGVKA